MSTYQFWKTNSCPSYNHEDISNKMSQFNGKWEQIENILCITSQRIQGKKKCSASEEKSGAPSNTRTDKQRIGTKKHFA